MLISALQEVGRAWQHSVLTVDLRKSTIAGTADRKRAPVRVRASCDRDKSMAADADQVLQLSFVSSETPAQLRLAAMSRAK